MNFKYHFENDLEFVQKNYQAIQTCTTRIGWTLLAKESISTIKRQFSICITCYVLLKYNKVPKLLGGTLVEKIKNM